MMDERTKAELIAQGCKVIEEDKDKIVMSCPSIEKLEFKKEE